VNGQVITNCAGSVTGTNIGATRETGEPIHDPAGNPGASSVWYQWQAPASGSVTITTVGSDVDFDTLLAVYTGNAVNGLTACSTCKNDDISSNPHVIQSSVTFTATAGTVYKIAVDGWGGDVGSVTLNWIQSGCPPATLFVEQGTSQLAAVDSVTFVRGPFTLTDAHNFSSDQRTRIVYFSTDLRFAASTQPNVSNLSVQINGNTYAVEAVGPSSTISGSYIVFRLPDLSPGTYSLTLRVFGVNSTNSPTITIVSSPNGPLADSSQTILNVLYPLVRLLL